MDSFFINLRCNPPPYMMHKLVLSFCELFIREDNILQINIFPGTEMREKESRLIEEAVLKLNNQQPCACLVFIGDFVHFGKEARSYGASVQGASVIKAAAYVVNNAGHKLVGNMFKQVDKPVRPIEIFYNETEAVAWLRKFIP